MKFIKRTILIIIILTAVIFLFRGWFFRHLVTYESTGQRTNYVATDSKLIAYIDTKSGTQTNLNVEQIIKRSLSMTSKQLNYTVEKNDIDPNKLINSKTAHCVGYAAFFARTCNYLLDKNNLADTWSAKTQIGQLNFLGANIHNYFKSSFFKNHDFVTIENKVTREFFAVDPTVHDYFRIDKVTYSKQ